MTYSFVFVTCQNYKSAEKISEILLRKKLIACANILPVKSKYWWRGKIENNNEILMIMKTRAKFYQDVKREVKKLHPYDIPEIVSFEIDKGNKAYLNWISEVTSWNKKKN